MSPTPASAAPRWMAGVSYALSVVFAVLFGWMLGQMDDVQDDYAATPMRIVNDSGSTVPVVIIDAWRGETLRGKTEGEVRLMVEGKAVAPAIDGSFSLGTAPKAPSPSAASVPEGAQFVASKRGKKYYPVGSSAGEGLSPANRIYFQSEAEAEAAGYVR